MSHLGDIARCLAAADEGTREAAARSVANLAVHPDNQPQIVTVLPLLLYMMAPLAQTEAPAWGMLSWP